MSCQPAVTQLIDKLVGERLRDISGILQRGIQQWNAQFGAVNIPPLPAPPIPQAAYELGALLGSVIRPLLPPIPIAIPPAILQEEELASAKLIGGVLTGAVAPTAVEQCVAHVLTDLFTGELFKGAVVKAGFQRRR